MIDSRIPVATYRIQFNQGFGFVDGRDLVPYLNDLGITELYSSPWFKARRGSSHGYDIADPTRINPELGTEEDFEEMALRLRHYDMGLLLDSVPNHMAASAENPWWRDVLENGKDSPFAAFFDINWHPPTGKSQILHENKVLLPVLGDLYGNVLHNQELTLKIEDTGFFVRYYDRRLPINLASSRVILEHSLSQLREASDPAAAELEALLDGFAGLPAGQHRLWERIWSAYLTTPAVKRAIDETLRAFNGIPGDAHSFDALDTLLARQHYRLAFWKVAYEEINYRRFFDINELVGLRVEVPEVFATRHARLFEMIRAGKVTGLRIDHVDGLYDPLGFLERLQGAIAPPDGSRFYVVVEKILGAGEDLPREWPIAGTTGYEFLNALNQVFIEPAGLRELERAYARHTGEGVPFAELCYAANKQVMEQLFPGEMNGFMHELGALAAKSRKARDIRLSELMQVLIEVTACLPIYRTYVRDFQVPERDRAYIERTLTLARARTPEHRVSQAAFDFLRRVLLLDPPYYAADQKRDWLRFLMRWQQFSGPVMAKGLEDTALYRDHSLISRNEVGSDPLREQPPLNLEGFHDFNALRLARWPHTLNATTTHDSKRSEDVRARLNVLSEIPEEWNERLEQWMQWNAPLKTRAHGSPIPGPADEILIYQTLLGVWPFDDSELSGLPARLKEFLTKAAREAKLHSSWMSPNQKYEQALADFVDAILGDSGNPFLESFREFQERVAYHGALNSLAQVLLKIAAPGVPDFYQGTETWNFSLVDPDNRRPVDYRRRIATLESLRQREAEDRGGLVESLVADWRSDGLKLFVTANALEFRRARRELFAEGAYVPLCASGCRDRHVVAFARRLGDRWAAVVTPRWTTRLGGRRTHLLPSDWGSTALVAPGDFPASWQNVFTGAEIADLRLSSWLADFPVALAVNL